jgi:hypothetical protein
LPTAPPTRYRIYQLHPSDTGGSFLEIDLQPGGDERDGPWMPAGPHWQLARRTGVVDGILGVEVQSRDVEGTASRWGRITGCQLDGHALRLDGATVTFSPGPLDVLVGVTLRAADASRRGEIHDVGGVRFVLA